MSRELDSMGYPYPRPDKVPTKDPESKMALLADLHNSLQKSADLLNKIEQKYPEVRVKWNICPDGNLGWKLAFFEVIEYLADLKTFAS